MKAYGYQWSWLLWNPDSAKKKFQKVGGGGALAETNNSTLPPIGNKPSNV